MSKKVKEQVKYNPSYSSLQRTTKVFKALIGNTNRRLCVFYLILVIFMVITSSCWVIFDTKDFLEDGATSMFGYVITFMAFTLFALNSCIPNTDTKTQETARSNVRGCATVGEAMMHLPISKLDVYRLSFRSYLMFMLFSSIHVAVLNIMDIADERFESAAASTGLLNLIYVSLCICTYMTMFNVFKKMNDKTKSGLLIGLLLIFYVAWMLPMLGIAKNIFELPVFGFFAGIPGIIMLICTYAAVIIIQKTVVEKRAASTAWYQR